MSENSLATLALLNPATTSSLHARRVGLPQSHHSTLTFCLCKRVLHAQYGGTASQSDRRHYDHSSSWRFHHHGSKRQTRSPSSPTRLFLSVAWNILLAANASRAETPVDGRGSEEAQRRSRLRNDPRSQPSPALSARCAGNPLCIETPNRGWEKALIRQFFEEELRCASAASSHAFALPTERGSRVIRVMRAAVVSPTQRTNCGNMGPLRIFRVLRV